MQHQKITLSSPPAYGLPFPSWRPNQREACERAINLPPGKTLMIELPTGAGKSGIAALVSSFRSGTTVLLGTTDLQSQYEATLPMFKSVWGQGRPPNFCVHPDHISSFETVYRTKPFRSECKYRKATACPHFSECPYEQSKIECMYAQARVLNHHYAFYARWWRGLLGNESDLFVDEGHNLPIALSGLVALSIQENYRRKYNLPAFPLAVGGAPIMLKKARDWAARAAAIMLSKTDTDDIRVRRAAQNKHIELRQFVDTIEASDDAEWYVDSRPGDKFFARPVVPGPYADRLLDKDARSIVLMSATIGGKSGAVVLAHELAIEDYEFVSYPHFFPKENRPVLFHKRAPKMSYRSTDKDYDDQIEMMAQLLRDHHGEKGIIHTASWKHAERIARGLKRLYNGKVIVPRGDRVGSIQAFKEMSGSVAVVSPSWKEGLSFDGDLCRWTIIAKVPWMSFGDPVVKLRAKRKGGRAWLDWNAALAVVQAAGRGVRSETDHATTYILDGNWPRVARMVPEWFEWEKV